MTEAGKALLDDLLALDKVQYQEGPVDFLGTVETELPAIEAEARAAVLRELREEVAKPILAEDIYQVGDRWYSRVAGDVLAEAIADILAAIDRRLGDD